MERQIIAYLPYVVRDYAEYRGICTGEQPEFELAWTRQRTAMDDQFIETATDYGISRWEAMLGIHPKPSETLDFRRDRVRRRLGLLPPFTPRLLFQKLDELLGSGNWEIETDGNYTLYLVAPTAAWPYIEELSILLDTMAPCNLIYTVCPRLDHTLLLSEQTDRIEIEYNYILGAWNLGEKPFVSVTELEVLKMAAQESIQQPLLDHTAKFAASDVASARVNGEVIITALTRSASGSEAYVSYPVRKDQAAQVDQVELLDQDGNVLTSSAVYLPLLEDQIQLRHKFIVKEGV